MNLQGIFRIYKKGIRKIGICDYHLEKGGKFKMQNPFAADNIKTNEKRKSTYGLIEINMELGEKIVLQRK